MRTLGLVVILAGPRTEGRWRQVPQPVPSWAQLQQQALQAGVQAAAGEPELKLQAQQEAQEQQQVPGEEVVQVQPQGLALEPQPEEQEAAGEV